MATMQQQIDAIDAAIASGERIVQYDGKRIEYRSIDELIRARDLLMNRVSRPSSASGILSDRMASAEFSRD